MVTSGSPERALSRAPKPHEDQFATSPLRFFGLRVEPDELRPLKPIVQLNKVHSGRPVFFTHSIEGIGATLLELAEALTCPVYCFQCDPNAPLESIETLAEYYIEVR